MAATSSGPAANGASHVAFVDALRGIAAVLVAVFHLQIHVFAGFPEKPILPGSFTWWLFLGCFDLGKYAVVVFFMVSGFLIPATLRRPGATLPEFLRRRCFRLYPAYWLAIALQVAALSATGSATAIDWTQVAANVTMLQKFVGQADFIGVFWTLQIEWTFYALCMVLFRFGWLMRRFEAQWVAAAMALACAAARWHTGKALPVALFLALVVMFAADTLRAVDEGLATRRDAWRALLVAAIVVVPAAWMGYRDEAVRYVLAYWAAIATFTVCWLGSRWFEPAGAVKGVLGFLGSTSYGIYLLAPIALMVVAAPLWAVSRNPVLVVSADLASTLLAAWLCHRFVEAPAIRLARRGDCASGA